MEYVYRIDWDDKDCKFGHNTITASAWSTTNLFAFTTEKIVEGRRKQYLNVLSLNQPWDVFSVAYKGGEIKCLEWDRTGTRFLSGDSHGKCCVWTLANNMSNRWIMKPCLSVDLPGEDILAMRWLHPGRKVLFHIDKMDSVNMTEKFQRLVFKPSALQCGGKPVDGYIFVTASGLVHVQCIDSDTDPTYGQTYLNLPTHQSIADIRFSSQGTILLLTSSGDINSFIRFHEVQLKYDSIKRNISFEVSMLSCLSAKCIGDENNTYTCITHAKFVSLDNQDKHVLICLSSPTSSLIEAWLLRKENVHVHKIFQQTSSPSHSTMEVTWTWQYITSSKQPKVLDIAIPSNVMDSALTTASKLTSEIKFFCGFTIAVTFANNSVRLLNRLSLQPLANYQVDPSMEPTSNFNLRCAVFSTLSCAMVTVDENGSIILLKLSPWMNVSNKAPTESRKQILQLLLYCLATGLEWWEIILHLSPPTTKSIVDSLAVEVQQQTKSLQQSLKSRFLAMKITLYQLSNSSMANDCHLKLLFEAISLVFRSLFRPPQQVTSEEQDPSLRLQIVCRTSVETDISHYLQSVDGPPQSLLCMQQFIQWVADVTLYLLASVPYHQMNQGFLRPCSTLIRDHEWLSLLRELLVIIRVWMLLKNACSPVFHILDSNLEVLPHSFRLITVLWQACAPEQPQKELPKALIDECCLLPSQIIIPPLEIVPAVNGVLSHLSLSSSRSLMLKFGEAQHDVGVLNSRQRKTELVALPGSSGKIDSLRRVYLGKRPTQELKECTRCGIVTMYNSLGPSMLKMWDQRFVKSCLCGGMWRKMDAG